LIGGGKASNDALLSVSVISWAFGAFVDWARADKVVKFSAIARWNMN
jgi:hypothetical protein